MINNTVKMSEFTEITQVDDTTKIVVIHGNPEFNAYIDANLIGGGGDGERSERISADESLTALISTESSNRLSSDILLGGEVSRVEGLLMGEVESRILVDTQLSTGILAEISQRISADSNLSNSILAEASQRISSDENLTSLILTETSNRISSDENLTSLILTETSNRISSDENLTSLILTETSNRILADESLTSLILTETSNRILADESLTSLILTETSNRISSDENLTTAISGEINSRISSDVSLSNELSITTSIAKGAQQAIGFANYSAMVTYLLSVEYAELNIGQSIYINTIDVPDVWISDKSTLFNTYTYVSDEQLISDINLLGMLQIGYFSVSFLETQKVDLTNYATTSALSTAISVEASDRIGGDTSVLNILNSSVSTETSQRIVGDSSLSTSISNETTARISGDTSVLNILNSSISSEASTRLSNDSSLTNAISTEKSERISGDASLTNRISSEESTRLSNDNNLSTSISTETSTRISGDTSLTNRISSEELSRIGGDTSLTNRISTETSQRISADNTLSTNILSETSQRISADVSLSTAIANITGGSLANLSDVDVTTKIDNDLLRFDATTGKWINETPVDILESVNSGELLMNVDGVIQGVTPQNIVADVNTSLTTRISSEEVNRVSGDSSLSTSISTEESARISADTSVLNTLTGSISTEASQRIGGDGLLSIRISNEISSRIEGDNSLTTSISNETSARISGDTSLSTSLSITSAIAIGTQRALSFNNYSSMVDYINNLEEPSDNKTYIGQSIYINTLDVPDVWISANIFPSYLPTPYNYVSDNQLIADVAAGNGYLQMGYYKISFLETQKVDLTNYATTSALSTAISSEASVRVSGDSSLTSALSTSNSQRISVDNSLSTALTTKIGNNTDTYTGTAAAQYIITLTQAEYDAIGTKNANTLYVII